MFAVLAFILLLNHSVSYTQYDFTREWRQKGLWTSNDNQTNVLSELLMVNGSTVEFEYVTYKKWAFLTFNGKDESSETVRVFLKMSLNKTSQTVKLQDYQAELSLYKKGYWKVRRINSTKISFNITFRMRQSLLFNSEKNNFKVQLLDVEKQYPQIVIELVIISALILVLLGAIFIKLIIENEYSINLGLFSIEIIQLWLIKCLYGIHKKAIYLQDSPESSVVLIISYLATSLLFVHFGWRFYILRKDQPLSNALKKKPNLFATILYLTLFLCLLSDSFPLRLWCILLIPIMNEVSQILECNYKAYKHTAYYALLLFVLYFFLIAVFPIYSQEIDYPKEQASAWWVYGVFYFLQVGLFYLKTKGGVAFLRRTKLLIAQSLKNQDYSKLKEYCPICFKSVAFSDVGLAEADEKMEKVDWVKGQCEHCFHKKCVKDNIGELNQCNIDNQKLTFTLKDLNE